MKGLSTSMKLVLGDNAREDVVPHTLEMYVRASLAHLCSVAAAVGSGGLPTRCPVGSLVAAAAAAAAPPPPIAAAAAAACDSSSGVL